MTHLEGAIAEWEQSKKDWEHSYKFWATVKSKSGRIGQRRAMRGIGRAEKMIEFLRRQEAKEAMRK